MRYAGFAAAGTLALLLGAAGAADAGSGGSGASRYGRGFGDGADFRVIEAGGGYRDEWHGRRHHGHRGGHRRHDLDWGHGHRRYSRGFPHHNFGYPYYEGRALYFQPYGRHGHGFRSHRGCD